MKSIISLFLMLISFGLTVKHGWDGLNIKKNPAQLKMMEDLGINLSYLPYIAVVQFALAIMLLFPKTYVVSNLLQAFIIVTIMALLLKAGNIKMALIEIPFLAMPLVMIALNYPFKK